MINSFGFAGSNKLLGPDNVRLSSGPTISPVPSGAVKKN
eukprot:XP_001709086.1 Hypothetical protein GL50803_22655 [Giardia lamblia ATCC 50803]